MAAPFDNRRKANGLRSDAARKREPIAFAKLIRNVRISDIYPAWKILEKAADNFLLIPDQKPNLELQKLLDTQRFSYVYSTMERIGTDQLNEIEFNISYPDELTTLFWEMQAREPNEYGTNQYKFSPKDVELATLIACLQLMNFQPNLKAKDMKEDIQLDIVSFSGLNIQESPRTTKMTLRLFKLAEMKEDSGEYIARYKPINLGQWGYDALYYLLELLKEAGCTIKITPKN